MSTGTTIAGAIAVVLATKGNDTTDPTAPDISGDASDDTTPASQGRSVVGHLNGQPLMLQLASIGGGYELEQTAAFAFIAMRNAAAADGVSFQLNSAFRTFEQQAALRALYESGKGNLAAAAGFSNHEAGRAADIDSANGTSASFQWLTNNAASWGFKRTVPTEPWHWEYST